MIGWLLDTLVYTGVIIALVLVLRRPFGRWFGPQLAYGLWALPFLRLLLPPIVLPASFAPQPAPSAALPAEPSAEWVAAAADMQFEPIVAAPVSAPLAAPAAAPPQPAWEWADFIAPALSLWAGVALAFLAWRVVTYRQMRRELLADARPVGEIGKVRLVETPALSTPVAFGVLDKVIALPPLFMSQRDIAARDLAIEHEVAHHKGHDLLANFAAQALLALHWFNPIAWYGWRAMRRDQEAACDARVLAGRGREDRLRYASLIAEVATGPRLIAFSGALAAPMACPVLGERSIVHRLRSLSMSEMSRRRRWFGRALVGASALALPLTASISYAAAQVQPVQPAPPADTVLPPAPVAPTAPEAPEAAPPGAGAFVLQRQDVQGGQNERQIYRFALSRDGAGPPNPPNPPAPPAPRFEFRGLGDPTDPDFEASMEKFEREMEKWSREMEDWGEKFGEQYAAQAESYALAAAEAGRRMPEVVESCDAGERARTTTADGRPRIVICEREIEAMAHAGALAGLRGARASIAHNSQIGKDVQREILADLDDEIERIERGDD